MLTVERPAVGISRKSHRFLGTWLNALTVIDLNALLKEAIVTDERYVIANHNMHSLYVYHHDRKMRDFYAKADFIHADGMAIVLLAKLLGLPLQREHRVTYADWVYSIMAEAAQNNWRIFYLGSKPGVAEQGACVLRQKHPSLQIEVAHGYFDADPNSDDNQQVVETINRYRPDILMVGMSMPRQEHWIADNLAELKTHVILPSGAAIDYVAGAVPTPPRWAGRWGLEWLFRLVAEPARLWQRYLVEPWFILKLLLF
ncbi:MAG: WecB/TagA/CpsF family glycosyltransferase [Phormidesmis sp. RL_2_1]|nr:WecB/TagA/CpsF family glycosyltransferase [Phormidesmis sp. RL_2_1]